MDKKALFATALSIFGAFLIALGSVSGFFVWLFANCIWIVVDIDRQFYEQIPIWIVYEITCCLGIYVWIIGI